MSKAAGPGPLARQFDAIDTEFWDDERGTVAFRTLFSADRTETTTFTCGVAMFESGGSLAAHRHEPPEIYFGIDGRARVMIAGNPHEIAPGTALFIPGNAVHSVHAETGPVRFFYAFARDSFDGITYHFDVEAD